MKQAFERISKFFLFNLQSLNFERFHYFLCLPCLFQDFFTFSQYCWWRKFIDFIHLFLLFLLMIINLVSHFMFHRSLHLLLSLFFLIFSNMILDGRFFELITYFLIVLINFFEFILCFLDRFDFFTNIALSDIFLTFPSQSYGAVAQELGQNFNYFLYFFASHHNC